VRICSQHDAWRIPEAFIVDCPGLFPAGLRQPPARDGIERKCTGPDTMSNLQDGSVDSDDLVRCAISRSIAGRAAESPPSRVAAITAELKDALAREAALLR